MANLEEELLNIKRKIETSKSNKDQNEGRKKEMYKRLDEKFKCSSLKSANRKKDILSDKIKNLLNKIEAKLEDVKEKYEV